MACLNFTFDYMIHSLGTKAYKIDVLIGRAVRKADSARLSPNQREQNLSKNHPVFMLHDFGDMVGGLKLCKLNSLTWTPFYILGLLFDITLAKKTSRESGLHKPCRNVDKIFLRHVFSDVDVLTRTEINFEEIKLPAEYLLQRLRDTTKTS